MIEGHIIPDDCFLTPAEVHSLLASLDADGRERIETASRYLSDRSMLPAEDLRQEAFLRLLRGSRRCRRDGDFVWVVLGVMKSLASAQIEAREGKLRPVILPPELLDTIAADDLSPEQIVLSVVDDGRMLSRIYDAVGGDEALVALIEALCDGEFGARLRTRLGVTEKEHDALRKRLRRQIASLHRQRSGPHAPPSR